MRNGRIVLMNLRQIGRMGDAAQKVLSPLGELYNKQTLSREEFAEIAPDVDILVSGSSLSIGKDELDNYPGLRMIANFGVGYDGYDLDEVNRRGLFLTHTPGVLTQDVADLAVGLMFAAARRIASNDAFVRSGSWAKHGSVPMGARVSGQRIGIAGLGRIGSAIARSAEGLNMQITYMDRHAGGKGWARVESMTELALASDFLVLAMNVTPENRHIVNAEVLEALGPKGFLINIARGSLVDTEALIAALQAGSIAGAGLDVFENEPEIDPRLFALENVVLSPHQGPATVQTRRDIAELVAENIRRVLAGEPPLTPVPGTRTA